MQVAIFDDMSQCTEQEVQRLLPLVSVQRREQALKYKHVLGQFCCLKSWQMLYEEIKELGDFLYNEHGKPYLENGPYFSISHCKEGIAVAIDDQPIGIDIEHIRHADKDLIDRVMNEEERVGMDDRKFTRLWTQKEAIVKAQGTGIYSFEQLKEIRSQESGFLSWRNDYFRIQTVEKEKYIYSIAYGKLHCIGA